jgi:hypothetical protein
VRDAMRNAANTLRTYVKVAELAAGFVVIGGIGWGW